MDSLTSEVASSLRVLMTIQGKTQSELARVLGTSPGRANRLFHGKSTLGMGELFAVADWLGVSPNQLRYGYVIKPRAA